MHRKGWKADWGEKRFDWNIENKAAPKRDFKPQRKQGNFGWEAFCVNKRELPKICDWRTEGAPTKSHWRRWTFEAITGKSKGGIESVKGWWRDKKIQTMGDLIQEYGKI